MENRQIFQDLVRQTLTGFGLDTSIKFIFEDGSNIMARVCKKHVDIEEDAVETAQCEFKATLSNAILIFSRQLSPPKAMITGKLKVTGDLGIALLVGDLLRKPLAEST